MAVEMLRVEVAYATPERQTVVEIDLPAGSTAEQAILASGLLQLFPEIDLNNQKIGIFSQICQLDKTLAQGDRVEIYRPLTQNPMEARRKRAESA